MSKDIVARSKDALQQQIERNYCESKHFTDPPWYWRRHHLEHNIAVQNPNFWTSIKRMIARISTDGQCDAEVCEKQGRGKC